jgi:AMP nucleosidase
MPERRFVDANNPDFQSDENVVLVPFGRESYLKAIVESGGAEKIRVDETTDRILYRIGLGSSGHATLMYSGMGSPACANALEMAAANGARRVVVFGACGGVVPEVAVGDLVVVSAAVRGEGTSRYYAPPEYPAVFGHELTDALWAAVRSSRQQGHLGVVYTTDAGYRQGPEVYEEHAGLIVAVESECAAAAVVGARLGIEVGALLFCSDNVTLPSGDDKSYKGLRKPQVKAGFETGLEVVLSVLADSSLSR